ncbi:MAG: T9SS type A sorting domain-containing protein [Bacteroidia bacterium]|nr:T9SS type A sorting domain-containing protein [Bacteroidia bacterium]
MIKFHLPVEQNSVYVEDDFTFGLAPGNPAPGWGISLSNSTNAKTISTNTLESMGSAAVTNSVSLVHCYYNFGNQSPNVHCNFTKNAHYGFQFEDRNDSTVWGGNHMCNEYAGLALVNNGIIGQQGNSGLGSENYWEAGMPTPLCMPWQLAPGSNARYQTYADNSIVSLSPLYVFQAPGFAPNINGSNPPNTGYNGSTILAAAAHNTLLLDCSLTNSIMPNWRMNNSVTNLINQSEKSTDEEWVNIYPNPTNGDLTISCKDEAGSCDVKIYDLQGRIVYQEQVKAGLENNCQINNLPASIYLIEVKKENKTIRKKLIKTN